MTPEPARLAVPAPAKLNLFLNITGRRADGYHELQTVFQLLDYGDQLHFQRRDDGRIALTGDACGVSAEANLISLAARLLQKVSHCSQGADIRLDKRLPLGGGLGGGSSDAATTLLALNHLWGTGLNLSQLAELGASLGADVPVFVMGKSAWAEGVGEQLQALALPDRWFLVARPDCSVSTAEIFQHRQLTRQNAPIKIAAFLEQGAGNVCEPLVRELYPAVEKAFTWLNQYAPAQLTGTGSCLFAGFRDEASARNALSEQPADLQCFVAKGVNESPVHQALSLS